MDFHKEKFKQEVKGKKMYKKQGMLVIRSFSLTIEVKNAWYDREYYME